MAESIYFESVIQNNPSEVQHDFIAPSGNKWQIEEKWSKSLCHMVQEIVINKKDDDHEKYESYYYVDLEIFPANVQSDTKIYKSERMCSTNIRFVIQGNEYSRFWKCFVGDTEGDPMSRQIYRFKVTLTPILQFRNEESAKPCRKRTKIDLVKGLKKLSEDLHFLLNEDIMSDVVICCGRRQAKAHRNILSVRSTLFCKLFSDLTEDGQIAEKFLEVLSLQIGSRDGSSIISQPSSDVFYKITLYKVSPSLFGDFIDFIYTGQYKIFDFQKTKSLLEVALDYGVYDLQKKCALRLKPEIWKETRKEIYLFAKRCKCEELQNYVLDHVRDKILGKRRRVRRIRVDEDQSNEQKKEWMQRMENIALEDREEVMNVEEKMKWLHIMKKRHPAYFQDIQRVRQERSIFFELEEFRIPERFNILDDDDSDDDDDDEI